MKTILVTGGCGFIGSHLVDKLIDNNYEVIVVDNLLTGSLKNFNQRATFYQIDVADDLLMEKVFEAHKIDYIVHQACKINTNALEENPLNDVHNTIISTLVLSRLAVRYGVQNLVFASSVAVYGNSASNPVSESALVNPIYSYGVAKSAAEHYLTYFKKYYGLNFQSLRYANVFGPRQPIYGEVGVIAIFTERFVKKQPLIVFGDGTNIRDYIFIEDVVEFTLDAINFKEAGIYNVGRGQPVTVNELLEIFKSLSTDELIWKQKPERFGEIGSFYCDVHKARQTGWAPKTNLFSGIQSTVKYCVSEIK
ncbi:NAD-dependent epimerase/dehydratase family protein [Alphaproteobacteria bacterium]|nr:NAD-dependent epimerase/dehydratase family protein [Alphaproteobacteria bacterium]